eukprot:6491368-Amphidinium_carterae.2
MRFLDEQRLGEPYLRREVPARRSEHSSGEADSEVYAATPRLESIRLLIAWAHMHGFEVKTEDFSVAFMFTQRHGVERFRCSLEPTSADCRCKWMESRKMS